MVSAHDLHAGPTSPAISSIAYADWRVRIEMASDLDAVVTVMRDYLECWRPNELRGLPRDVAATAITGTEDIFGRAVVASRAELAFTGLAAYHTLLREMALTYTAAAVRLRQLMALREQ